MLEAEDVAVVGGAAWRVGEDGVGFGEEGEGGGGGGVVAVCVWVVDFGELVEGPRVARWLALMLFISVLCEGRSNLLISLGVAS